MDNTAAVIPSFGQSLADKFFQDGHLTVTGVTTIILLAMLILGFFIVRTFKGRDEPADLRSTVDNRR